MPPPQGQKPGCQPQSHSPEGQTQPVTSALTAQGPRGLSYPRRSAQLKPRSPLQVWDSGQVRQALGLQGQEGPSFSDSSSGQQIKRPLDEGVWGGGGSLGPGPFPSDSREDRANVCNKLTAAPSEKGLVMAQKSFDDIAHGVPGSIPSV